MVIWTNYWSIRNQLQTIRIFEDQLVVIYANYGFIKAGLRSIRGIKGNLDHIGVVKERLGVN